MDCTCPCKSGYYDKNNNTDKTCLKCDFRWFKHPYNFKNKFIFIVKLAILKQIVFIVILKIIDFLMMI